MKKITLLLLIFGLTFSWAQEEEALVFFINKPDVASSIANPATILTQRAINRKQKHDTPINALDVPVDPQYISQLKTVDGLALLAKSKWLNSAYVRGDRAVIEDLPNLEYITSVEFMNKQLNASSKTLQHVNKWNFEIQKRANYNYGDTQNQTEMISINKLHDQDFTGSGMLIAVMDSGFPSIYDSPAFAKAITENRLLGTYDFVDRGADVTGTGSHGALTWSDMGGFLDTGFLGTAPDASYYLFRTEYGPTESPVEEAWWVEALERADSLGVDVVNTSLGYRDFDNANYNHSYADLDGMSTLAARGATIAFDKGLLIVTSAGNGGRTDFKTVGTPADSPYVLSVGAVSATGDYAEFSSVGPTVDGRIKPDVVAQGDGAAAVDTDGNVVFVNGTSFSSPIMAGAVACLWQALPDLNNDQIMQLVRQSAHLYAMPSDRLGYGIPDFEKALANGQSLSRPKAIQPKQFKLANNPVQHQITLIFPQNVEKAQCALYDILGTKIKSQSLQSANNTIDVSDLARGIYILTVKTSAGNKSFKVVKR